MVDRDDVKGFIRFIEEANDAELIIRKEFLRTAAQLSLSGSDARRDYQFLLRKLVEEQVAREEVRHARMQNKPQLRAAS